MGGAGLHSTRARCFTFYAFVHRKCVKNLRRKKTLLKRFLGAKVHAEMPREGTRRLVRSEMRRALLTKDLNFIPEATEADERSHEDE